MLVKRLKQTLGVISCDKVNEKFIKRSLKNHRDVDVNNNKLPDSYSSFRAAIAVDDKYLQMRMKFRMEEKLRLKQAEKEVFEALAGKQEHSEQQVPRHRRLQFLLFKHRYVLTPHSGAQADQSLQLLEDARKRQKR